MRVRRGRPEPLFDISGLDLSSIRVDRDGIGKRLPHRGVMAQLDGVVWTDDGFTRGVAVKHVRSDEFWCAGHIPGRPILPGVLMVEAGAQLASYLYHSRLPEERRFAGFTRIQDTVFRGSVEPDCELYLLSKEVRFSPKRFIADVQGVVGDTIVFESQVTGMLIR